MSSQVHAARRPARTLAQLGAYLQLLVGDGGRGYLEIRYRHRTSLSRLFVGTRRLDAAARTITTLAGRTDVYCGAVLRTRHAGGRDAVADSHLVWVEIDRDDALQRLDAFASPASMIIRSGTSGHAHAYWQLRRPISVEHLEAANRRLACHLGGDPVSTDAARILRPCGTLNHKHTPPAAVTLAAHRPARRYELAELVDDLPDPPRPPRRGTGHRARARGMQDAALLAIATEAYVRALTGRQAGRDGKVSCPFHEDSTPSLHAYDDGTFYCYGCGAGGSIYDFAGTLWLSGQSSGVNLRGRRFIEVRDRLASIFLGDADVVADRGRRSGGRSGRDGGMPRVSGFAERSHQTGGLEL
jgi:hypothetical protein